MCKFLRHCFDDLYAEAGSLYEQVTGAAVDLPTAGAHIVALKKRFNQRQGWTRADDTLPERLFDRDRLDGLIEAYYLVRGWSPEGMLPDILLPQ